MFDYLPQLVYFKIFLKIVLSKKEFLVWWWFEILDGGLKIWFILKNYSYNFTYAFDFTTFLSDAFAKFHDFMSYF